MHSSACCYDNPSPFDSSVVDSESIFDIQNPRWLRLKISTNPILFNHYNVISILANPAGKLMFGNTVFDPFHLVT